MGKFMAALLAEQFPAGPRTRLYSRQQGRSLQTTFTRALKQGSTPFTVHPPLGRPGGLNVRRIEAGVADHANAGLAVFRLHPFQGLGRHLQEGGAEEPGNPVVPAGALQPGCQEILQGTAYAGNTRITPDFFQTLPYHLPPHGKKTLCSADCRWLS